MQRADLLLVQQQLADTRTQAQRLIRTGRVHWQDQQRQWQPVNKSGLKLAADTPLQVQADPADRYVSRGALKLDAALTQFELSVQGVTALDIGQSTGGFTDCLLQAGAATVVGVDVGHDQLAPALKNHPAVICYEGINARQLPADLRRHSNDRGFDLIVMDVSFISQTLILPGLPMLLAPQGQLISLVKPQFEVGKAGVGKGGIVRDSQLYPQVEQRIRDLCQTLGFVVQGYMPSPIKGGDGNQEFLLWASYPCR